MGSECTANNKKRSTLILIRLETGLKIVRPLFERNVFSLVHMTLERDYQMGQFNMFNTQRVVYCGNASRILFTYFITICSQSD